MSRKMPSLIALVGMAALAGFKNRRKIQKFVEQVKDRSREKTSVGEVPSVARVTRPTA